MGHLIYEGYLFNHGLTKMHDPGFDSEYHVRVVMVAVGTRGPIAWELVVEREGFRDAMGQPTWDRVGDDDRIKILAQVGVIMQAQTIATLEGRVAELERSAVRAINVTVPGEAVGQPPKD